MTHTQSRPEAKRGIFSAPGSWVGWVSAVLAVAAIASLFARRLVGGVRGSIAIWILAGVVALVAVLGKKERSILVLIPLVIGGLWAFWAAASYIVP